MKKILKNQYGINGKDELEAAMKSSSGINIGIFTEPFNRSNDYEPQEDEKITA
nr:MAG TPA: hypothetical protein [Caudoviricetes sp.]